MGHYDEQRQSSAEKWREQELELKQWGATLKEQQLNGVIQVLTDLKDEMAVLRKEMALLRREIYEDK